MNPNFGAEWETLKSEQAEQALRSAYYLRHKVNKTWGDFNKDGLCFTVDHNQHERPPYQIKIGTDCVSLEVPVLAMPQLGCIINSCLVVILLSRPKR